MKVDGCSLCSFGNFPGVRSIKADVSELNVGSIVLGDQEITTRLYFITAKHNTAGNLIVCKHRYLYLISESANLPPITFGVRVQQKNI